MFTIVLRMVTGTIAIPFILRELVSGNFGPTGRYTHIDQAATLHVTGNVLDEASQPVAGAEISLVDRGLDSRRSRSPERSRSDLGVSNPYGSIDFRVTYTWGSLTRNPQAPPVGPQPFGIRVDNAGHNPNEQLFDMAQLQRGSNNAYEIDLGTVRLTRSL